MEDRKLNEKESLDLIARMIRNTQSKMEQNSGRTFLTWGYLSLVVALIIWYATITLGDYRWSYLWFIIPVIGWPMMILWNRKGQFVNTFIDRIVNNLWLVIGVAIIIACLMSIFIPDLQSLFFSALILGMGAASTGLIVRVKAVAVTGFLGMMISPVTLFLKGGDQILVFAALFVVMMIIPGHILSYKNKK